jgi:hypothetical protein
VTLFYVELQKPVFRLISFALEWIAFPLLSGWTLYVVGQAVFAYVYYYVLRGPTLLVFSLPYTVAALIAFVAGAWACVMLAIDMAWRLELSTGDHRRRRDDLFDYSARRKRS